MYVCTYVLQQQNRYLNLPLYRMFKGEKKKETPSMPLQSKPLPLLHMRKADDLAHKLLTKVTGPR